MSDTPDVVEDWTFDDEIGVHAYTLRVGDDVVVRAAITPNALIELGKAVVLARLNDATDTETPDDDGSS